MYKSNTFGDRDRSRMFRNEAPRRKRMGYKKCNKDLWIDNTEPLTELSTLDKE